jgi:aspartate-semialdehyde dehydrogenase
MTVLAIVHPNNLLGKELRETLGRDDRSISWQEVRLLSPNEQDIGILTEVAGAAALVQRFDPEGLEGVSAVFFCGPIAANRPLLAAMPPEVTAVVLSPDATAEDGYPVVAGINQRPGSATRTLVSPHPAAVLLAHLLQPLAALCEVRQVTATVLQPTSMYDEPGIEGLFEQTRQIVAMTARRRSPVFGPAQVAFNLLPAAQGEAAAASVAAALASVLPAAPRLALQILQAGVFHGLAVSLHVSTDDAPSLPALRKALTAGPYVAVAEDARHLGPIDAAGSDKVLLGPLRRDSHGFWIWAAMDNLTRGGALNAVEIAAEVH